MKKIIEGFKNLIVKAKTKVDDYAYKVIIPVPVIGFKKKDKAITVTIAFYAWNKVFKCAVVVVYG